MNIQDNIYLGIYSKLSGISGSGASGLALCSGRFYREQAPQEVNVPYVVYTIVNDTPIQWFQAGSSEDLTNATIQFSIFDRKENGTRNITNIGNDIFYSFQNSGISISGLTEAFTYAEQRGIVLRGGLTAEDKFYSQYIQLYRLHGSRDDKS